MTQAISLSEDLLTINEAAKTSPSRPQAISLSEDLLTINEAAKTSPSRPHIATVWRWAYTGVKGVKLETITIGGRRYTSREALQRFIERTTAAADRQPIPTRSAKQRERAIAAAERELVAAGA